MHLFARENHRFKRIGQFVDVQHPDALDTGHPVKIKIHGKYLCLKQLGQQAGELVITLTGEVGSTRQVDGRSLDVLTDLQTDLSPEIHELKASPQLPEEILNMQQHVLDPGAVKQQDTPKPFLLEARSQSDEAARNPALDQAVARPRAGSLGRLCDLCG